MNNTHSRFDFLRKAFILNIGMLALLYTFGMYINIYGFGTMNSFPIMTHMILATLLTLVSVAAIAVSVMEKSAKHIYASIASIICVAVAFTGGMLFVANGQQNAYSLIMALGFLGAFIANMWGAAIPKQQTATLIHQ